MRKWISLALMAAMLLSVGGSALAQNSPTDLSFWLFNAIHEQFYRPGVEAWNAENPDRQVNVTFETYPNQELGSKLLIALQSGSGAPDIVDININYFSNFLSGDIQLAPLNRVVDPVRSQFIESRFDIYSRDGVVYGLPTHVGATVVYYTKTLTDAAGIDIDAIDTWADFEEAGVKYLAATGKPFVGVETGNQRPFWPMIVQRGGDYLDQDGNVVLDSDVNIEVLTMLNKWVNELGIAVPLPGGSTATEETFSFINSGGIAALIMPMWYMSRYINYMPDIKGNVFIRPMPVVNEGDARSAGIGGTGTAVTLQSKNVDLAVDLLAFLKLTPEANIRIWQYARFDPPRWDVWDRPELQQPDEYFGGEVIFNTLLDVKDNIPSPNYNALSTAAQDTVMNTVMFQALEMKLDPAQVLRDAAADLRAQQQ
ncbi:MAG TPA: extracellular solute-binding protein [Candidatus Limnocylindria bacterium]|nr:extracellular solute-binding protein [Candidatus Limnocylindria bacterium]